MPSPRIPIAFDYSHDGAGQVYWQQYCVKGAEADSFVVLNRRWARDKDRVYIGRGEMRADPASFEVLNDTWARDRKNVYIGDSKRSKADRETFRVLNYLFAKDKNHVFYLEG